MSNITKKTQTKEKSTSKSANSQKLDPIKTNLKGEVVTVEKKEKEVIATITNDNQIIEFNSIDQAKEIAEKLKTKTKNLDYIKLNIDFMRKVQAASLDSAENSTLISSSEGGSRYGILVMPVEDLEHVARHRKQDEYTIIQRAEVVGEFAKFTIKVLDQQKEILEASILNTVKS